jgi:hypothetical protein
MLSKVNNVFQKGKRKITKIGLRGTFFATNIALLMKTRSLPARFPRWRLAAALMACAALSGWLATPDGHSQAASAGLDARSMSALAGLVGQLKLQQDKMAANQTKVEAQTAALKEEMRLLKIYSARGGGGGRR